MSVRRLALTIPMAAFVSCQGTAPLRGPLAVRNLHPAQQTVLHLPARGSNVLEAGQLRGRADVGLAIGERNLASDCARGTGQLIVVGLQEAPFDLRIIGEGAAGHVVDAAGLALVERDVLHGAQVEAEIITVFRDDDRALCLRRLGWKQTYCDGKEERGETDERTHRPKSSKHYQAQATLETSAGYVNRRSCPSRQGSR